MKYCKDCQVEKPKSEFHNNKITKDKLGVYCKPCQMKRVNSNPNQLANVRRAQLKRLYNTTPEHYDKLFEKQQGVCAICTRPESGKREYLCIDHDHKTGFIRGLLCHDCNLGIGKLKDSVELLENAIWYLQKSQLDLETELKKIMTDNLEGNQNAIQQQRD